MLVLSRRRGESIMIGTDIELSVLEVRHDRVRLGLSAPDSVRIRRSELKPDHRTAPLQVGDASLADIPRTPK